MVISPCSRAFKLTFTHLAGTDLMLQTQTVPILTLNQNLRNTFRICQTQTRDEHLSHFRGFHYNKVSRLCCGCDYHRLDYSMRVHLSPLVPRFVEWILSRARLADLFRDS